jgi:hypothetical protein
VTSFSGSLAMFAGIRRALSRVSSLTGWRGSHPRDFLSSERSC